MRDSIIMSPKCELSQAKSQVEMNANSSPTFNDVISTGDTLSLVHLISMCARLKGYTKAERALKKASDTGSIQATFALMLLYYYGLVEGGLTALLRCSRRAAYAYHVPSMNMLGCLLKQGIALQDYPQEGKSWLKMASILDPKGKNSHKFLDPSKEEDETLIEDIIDALEGPLVIFDPKNAAASVKRLNTPLPKSGKFVELNRKPKDWEVFQDYSREAGFKMIRQAAEDGYVTAMYYASTMYRCGYGTESDSELADAWFYVARRLDKQNKGLRMVDFVVK